MADPFNRKSAFSKPSSGGNSGGDRGGNEMSGPSTPPANSPGGGDDLEPSLEPGAQKGFSFEATGDGNVYVPRPNDSILMPEMVKVDIDTPLEQFFTGLWISCLIISGFLFWGGVIGTSSGGRYNRHYNPPNPELLKYLPWTICLAVFAFIVRQFIDNFYVMNTREKTIYYHFGFFGQTRVSTFLTVAEIAAFGVTGRRQTSRQRHSGFMYSSYSYDEWWEYMVCVITHDGRVIEFGNFERDSRIAFNSQAKGMAVAFAVPFAECPPESSVGVDASGQGAHIYFTEYGTFSFGPKTMTTIMIYGGLILATIAVMAFLSSVK